MIVPFFDLKKQYEYMKNSITKAIDEVMQTQQFILGDRCIEFEKNIAEFLGIKYALGVSSGTDALIVSLMALDIGAGDEVITTPFTFVATAEAIARVGATPVFADINPETFNLDPSKIADVVTSKTKAIIPVHCFGQCADMHAINLMAKRNNLFVIEDAAQAIGAKYMGLLAGTMGNLGCFSFFPSKNLACCGDGGLVVTNEEELYFKVSVLRNHGRSRSKYDYEILGGNFRLDEMQANILNVKLPRLHMWNLLRQKIAKFYDEQLKYVLTPVIHKKCTSVYNQYVIKVDFRDELRQYLADNGIGTEIYWPRPLHTQGVFKQQFCDRFWLPNAVSVSNQVLALPIFPELTLEQQKYVIKIICEFYDEKI